MNFRRATINDIEGILALQAKYLITNVPESKRAEGFVTTPFTIDQLKEVLEFHGLFIAETNGQIVAYVFGASWQFFSQWKIFEYMVSRFPNLSFDGQLIDDKRTFQYGPVCIDLEYRGSGLLQNLFETMRKGMEAQYPIAVTFINKLNKRSYEAHTKKLGLKVIDEFTFNNNEYYALAFHTNKSVLT